MQAAFVTSSQIQCVNRITVNSRSVSRKRVVSVRSETPKQEGEPEKKAPTSGSFYADELPEVPRREMSDAMKEKMRREYYGLGGSPNQPMSGNYFLYIILIVAFLAILSAALGYI